MGKALVIKNVDFSDNKLATVTLIQEIPCTALSLNKSSTTLSNIGTTETLTATATPSNTTDTVVWSTSNSRIATVSAEGLVTVTGAGTATITATCGAETATCTVTATHTLSITKSVSVGTITKRPGSTLGSKNSVIQLNTDSTATSYGIGYQTDALTKGIYNKLNDTTIYPVYFGHANTLTITAPSTIRVTVCITDSTHTAPTVDSAFSGAAVWLKADENGYDGNVSLGNRTVTDIPENADSVGFTFQKPGSTVSLEDLSTITVVAS